jgi:alcohol dehydrogenase class IV
MTGFTLRSANEITFGSGTRRQIGEVAAAYGTRTLIVTGRSDVSRRRAEELVQHLQEAGLSATVFAQVEPEPSLPTVEAGRQALRDHAADVVIAVGGGSAMDVGKAIGALGCREETVGHFFATGAAINGFGLPVIAMPTTSGTGAEVTPNSVFTDPATRHKASIRGAALMPRAAIVDPELTLELPREQTAFSGLDALTQAIESYTSTGANVVSDMLAQEATARIAGSLRRACEVGTDLPAREDMALGSLLAGLALASARLGLVHGLAHPLGALYHLPHGRVCGWLLPAVMRFNLEAAGERYARLAERIGLPHQAEALVAWVEELACELGACGSWAAVGLKAEDFARIAPVAAKAGSSKFNPRPVTEENVREFLGGLL